MFNKNDNASVIIEKICYYCNNNLITRGAVFNEFPIYFLLFNILPYLVWMKNNDLDVYLFKLVRSIKSISLMIENIWIDKNKKYLGVFWFSTLLFCLPRTSFVILFLNDLEYWSIISFTSSYFYFINIGRVEFFFTIIIYRLLLFYLLYKTD